LNKRKRKEKKNKRKKTAKAIFSFFVKTLKNCRHWFLLGHFLKKMRKFLFLNIKITSNRQSFQILEIIQLVSPRLFIHFHFSKINFDVNKINQKHPLFPMGCFP